MSVPQHRRLRGRKADGWDQTNATNDAFMDPISAGPLHTHQQPTSLFPPFALYPSSTHSQLRAGNSSTVVPLSLPTSSSPVITTTYGCLLIPVFIVAWWYYTKKFCRKVVQALLLRATPEPSDSERMEERFAQLESSHMTWYVHPIALFELDGVGFFFLLACFILCSWHVAVFLFKHFPFFPNHGITNQIIVPLLYCCVVVVFGGWSF